MVFIPRLAAFLCLLLCLFTLIRPRSGWGRLTLFIPKLLAGSLIFPLGMLGLAGAAAGWFIFRDIASLCMGLGAGTIAARHILRIIRRSARVGKEIAWEGKAQKTMLAAPWVVLWRAPGEAAWEQDVLIGTHAETGDPILADLWRPEKGNESGLGIIYLHGSGWHYADKDFGTRHFFQHLRRQGHLVLDVAYTLAPRADLFGMTADVKRAIQWMKNDGAGLGIDPRRVILMGGSAGGHLALLAAYTPNHARLDPPDVRCDTSVAGVVSYYGPPDLRAQYERFNELPGLTGKNKRERMMMDALERRFGFKALPVHSLLPVFMGGTPQDIPELYDLGSPCRHVGRHCPPTLLLQGGHDFSGAAPEVRKLHTALREAGCRAALLEIPEAEHGFDLYRPNWSPAAQGATHVTERFLAARCAGTKE